MLHLLKHGDRIHIGNTQLLFEMSAAPQYGLSDSNRPAERASYVQQGQVVLPPTNTAYGGGDQRGYPSAAPVHTPPSAPAYTPNNATPVLQPSAPSASGPGMALSESMQQRSQPVPPPPPPNPRRRWLIFGITGLVVLIVLAVIGFIIFPRPTPAKALDTFCKALQSKDYQMAYSDLSSGYKNKISLSGFQAFFANDSSCTYGSPSQSSNSATASLTTSYAGRTNNDTVTLTQSGSNGWRIVDIASLSALTKTLDTFCNAWKQGDYPTAYNQLSGTMQSKMTEQQMTSFFPKVTSCKYDSLTMSANGASVALTTTTSAQTENETISLVQDSSNSWKISDFASLPDKNLDAFCTALQNKDYQTAYNQTSDAIQSSYPESQFAKDFSWVTSCTHNFPTMTGNTAKAVVTLGDSSGQTVKDKATLIQDKNGDWKIDSLQKA